MTTPIATIQSYLSRSASWRRQLARKFPDDPRNILAAVALEQLAGSNATGVGGSLGALAPHLDSRAIYQALSEASRDVGFRRHPESLEAFLKLVLEKVN